MTATQQTTAIQASTQAVATSVDVQQATALFQKLVINSDLSSLTQVEQIEYYKLVCQRVGLDPYQKPFDLIKLSGKLVLYANKTCTAQLTQLRNLKVSIVAREVVGDQYVVTARCETQAGGFSEDIGAVPIANLRGDAASNAMKKASTQAKRRAILAACGLGMLDEEETYQIAGAERVALPAIEEALTDDQQQTLADMLALIDGATTAEEMTAVVAELKTADVVLRDKTRDALVNKQNELGLVWNRGAYQEVQRGKK